MRCVGASTNAVVTAAAAGAVAGPTQLWACSANCRIYTVHGDAGCMLHEAHVEVQSAWCSCTIGMGSDVRCLTRASPVDCCVSSLQLCASFRPESIQSTAGTVCAAMHSPAACQSNVLTPRPIYNLPVQPHVHQEPALRQARYGEGSSRVPRRCARGGTTIVRMSLVLRTACTLEGLPVG